MANPYIGPNGQSVDFGSPSDSWKSINTEAINTLLRNRYYEQGDIAYSRMLPSWAILECTTAGTTNESEPSIDKTTVKIGDTITDGTAEWVVLSYKPTELSFLTVDKAGYTVINQNAVYDANLKVDASGYIVFR